MTKHAPNDETRTRELMRQLETDSTWLRHRGLAAELDRRLLQGAFDAELAEVRQSWQGHIRHLRQEHGIVVTQSPEGVWRIVGAHGPAAPISEPPAFEGAEDALGVDEDYEEDLEDLKSSVTLSPTTDRFQVTAGALAALAKDGLLANPLLKDSVGMMIRRASESNHWHNCAHYRSHDAAAALHLLDIRTPARYQAECRRRLRHEHVVPNGVIYKMLCASSDLSSEAIHEILSTYCIRATITLAEDERLRECGLAFSMPEEFDDPYSTLFRHPMSRYIVAGLFESLVPRPDRGLWFPDTQS